MNDGDARLTWSSDHSFKRRLAWEGSGSRGPLKLIAPDSDHPNILVAITVYCRILTASDFLIRTIQMTALLTILTCYESSIGDLHSVMNFILGLQTAQNRDCAFDGRFINSNWLESPFECRVSSDGFAVLVRCGSSRFKCRILMVSEALQV